MKRARAAARLGLLALGLFALGLCAPGSARAEVTLLKQDPGWWFTLDGRVNAFLSFATGTGLPDEPDFLGAGTNDTKTSTGSLHSTRIRNGFMTSILGFTGKTEVSPNLKVTTRIALWMNIAGSRSKSISALVDPRELYGKLEGPWGSVLAGSDLSLFGRGGILMDAEIAHEFGLGYPCGIRDASGGACGMTAFGAPFPGFDPGLIYATPSVGGFQLSLGVYDPATIGNASLNRAPLPRLEGEAKFQWQQVLKLYASGFWQILEGTVPDNSIPNLIRQKDLRADAWGAQAGAMLGVGPVLLGAAAYEGAGFSPITYIDEHQTAADSTGTLRKSRGVFALGAVLIDSWNVKVAGGVGVLQFDKNENDKGTQSSTGSPEDPKLIRRNLGTTLGIYQTTLPLHFAVEYFHAQHTWYDRGVPLATDATMTAGVSTPEQSVDFINAGMTITW